MVPLPLCREGQEGIVKEVRGGKEALRRLSSLGIYPGAKVKVLSSKGLILIRVGESRIGLGFGIANKVIGEVESEALRTKSRTEG